MDTQPPMPIFPHPTCVGYCRVSTVEQAQHGWSIEQQEDSIRAWAKAQGLDLVAVFRDAGRSGRTMQHRSGLLGLLELVHQGGIGVVVAKAQDRLARAVDHAIGLRQWLHRHGSDLLFLDGNIHLHAAEGKGDLGAELITSLTSILAEEEINTLRRRIIPNVAIAARAGRRGGRLPLGYRRQPDGTIVVEPHDADLVARAVQEILAGVGASRLARRWITNSIRDATGAVVTFDRLRGALTNRYLTGELIYHLPVEVEAGGQDASSDVVRIPSHHPTLIDPVTFAAVQVRLRAGARSKTPAVDPQVARRQRRQTQRRANRLPASGDLLTALRPPVKPVHGAVPPEALRCGHCGGPMYASLQTVGGVGKRQRRAVYLCRYHKDHGMAFCPQPPVAVEIVDEAVFTAVHGALRLGTLDVAGLQANDELMPGTVAHNAAEGGTTVPGALMAAQAKRDRLQASLTQLGDQAPAVLHERLAETMADITRLTTLAQRQTGDRPEPTGPSWALRRRPQATWEALDTPGRRAALAPLLARVVVRGKVVVSVSVRDVTGASMAAPVEPLEAAS